MKKFASFALFLALLTTILTGCGGTSSSISSDPAVPAPAGEDVAAAPADDVPEPSAGEQPEPAGEPAEASVVEEELPEEALPYPAELQLPLTETPKSLSFWYSGFPNFDFDVVFGQNPAIAKAEELTGVHADMNIVSMDSYSEKFNLMIATGEYPDLISTGDYVGGYAQAVNDEVIIDITDYVETCALNYMALISQDEITKKSAYSDDSRIYGFASIQKEAALPGNGPIVRQDWLDALGLEPPETYVEYEAMLAAFQSELGATEPFLMNSTGIDSVLLAGFDTMVGFYVVDGAVQTGYTAKEMRDYVTMIHDWYENGYIGQSFTANPVGQPDEADILSDTAGCWTSGYQFSDYEEKASNPNYALTGTLYPVKEHGGIVHTSYQPVIIDCATFFSVTSCCEDPELAVKWMDFWYSEPGFYLANYGVEGLSYDLIDGEPVMTELMTDNPDGLDVRATVMYYTAQLNIPYYKDTSNLNSAYEDYELAARELWRSNQDGAYVIPTAVAFNSAEADAYGLHITDIETYADENLLKFIVGDRPLEEWDDYVAVFQSLGIDACTEAYQNAYDRFMSR